MDQQLEKAETECHVPSDSPTLYEKGVRLFKAYHLERLHIRRIHNDEDTTLMLADSGKNTSGKVYIVDSGSNINATSCRKDFSLLTTDKAGIQVKMANGNILWSHGCGCVTTKNYTLPNVHYVPGLGRGLVSVSELNDLGYSLVFTRDNGCLITDDRNKNLVVGKGTRGASGLFELHSLRVPLDRTRSETDK